MSLCKLRSFTNASALSVALLLLGQQASAAPLTVVESAGPAATFTGTASNPVNFTTEGSYAWVFFAGTTNNSPASPPFQKSTAPSAFTSLVGLTPTGTTTVGSSRTGSTANGVAAAVTTTDSTSTNLTNLPGYTYVSQTSPSTGNGMRTSYTVPAGATQTLSVYCYTLNGAFGRMKLTDTDGSEVTSLYDDGASGVQLPTSVAQPTKGGGVYRFTVENTDPTPRTLTFDYTIAAFPSGAAAGTLAQLGFEGITAATVPEPASVALIGIAGIGLLARRRRSARGM